MGTPPAEAHGVGGQTDVHPPVCLRHMVDHKLVQVCSIGSTPDLARLQDDEGLLADHNGVVGHKLGVIYSLQPL